MSAIGPIISKEFEEKFEKSIQQLYDDFFLEDLNVLIKKYKNNSNSNNIKNKLEKIYKEHKTNINILLEEEGKKLLDKQSYENLVYLKNNFC